MKCGHKWTRWFWVPNSGHEWASAAEAKRRLCCPHCGELVRIDRYTAVPFCVGCDCIIKLAQGDKS